MGKFTRPIMMEVFPCRRLFASLDKLCQHPLIWISGPGGCGKTTLVGSYLQERGISCLWYQVEEGDKDPATFFYYLSLATKKALPRRNIRLPLFTPECSQGLLAFSLNFFEKLFGFIKPSAKKGRREKPFFVVFDNFQEAPEESPLSEIILKGLSRIPEGMAFIILSRSDPPESFIRLRANNQMGILGWDELRLNLAETEGIIRLRNPEIRSREMFRKLHAESDGWAAGLVLMVEKGKKETGEIRALDKGSREEIFAYFAAEILRKTEPEIRDFLLKTSLFPRMTALMAEDLTGISSAARILGTLSRNHFFTEKRVGKDIIFQYHPLFKAFLCSHGKAAFPENQWRALSKQAATILERHNQVEEAVRLLSEIQDWRSLVPILLNHALNLFNQGRNRVLEDWIGILPEAIIADHPWLLFWLGTARIPFAPARAATLLEKAVEEFKAREDLRGLLSASLRLINAIEFEGRNLAAIDRLFPVLKSITEKVKESPSPETEFLLAINFFYALFSRQGESPEIDVWAERALALVGKTPFTPLQTTFLAFLTTYWLNKGELEKATRVFPSIQKDIDSEDAPILVRVRGKNLEFIYFAYQGWRDRCLNAIEEGLRLSQSTGAQLGELLILHDAVWASYYFNEVERANRYIDRMGSLLREGNTRDSALYHSAKSLQNLWRGDFSHALDHADLQLKLAVDLAVPHFFTGGQLIKTYILHGLGRVREAEGLIAEIATKASRIYNRHYQFSALLASAFFNLEQRKDESCLEKLRQALALGRREGYFWAPIFHPRGRIDLFARALQNGIEVEYVRELIRRLQIIPDKSFVSIEDWPWLLKIYTLGKFQILIHEKPIRFLRKVQQKPLSMLKALVTLGGSQVREDQIEDFLWPDADGDKAHMSFMMTLHRLRQLLGLEKAIQHKEGRLTLESSCCWVDTWAFEHLLEEADRCWKSGQNDEAIRCTEKAVSLYKGAFLPEWEDEPLALSLRERLKSKLIRGATRMAGYWEKDGQPEKAAEWYERVLEANDLIEELYLRLMTCYDRMGRKAEALAVYQRCRKTLAAALGIVPSAKTESAFQSFLSSANT